MNFNEIIFSLGNHSALSAKTNLILAQEVYLLRLDLCCLVFDSIPKILPCT